MKKIIPFSKDIKFNTNIYEITSISLEHNLSMVENDTISGEFIVSGDYKMNDTSLNTEPFIHGIPFDITLDSKYDVDKMKIDIDDFKFEIVNEEILRVNIDVLIEGTKLVELLEEEPVIEEIKPSVIIEAREKEEEEVEDIIVNEEVNLEFNDNFVDDEKEEEERLNITVDENLFKEVDEKIEKVDSDNQEKIMSIFNNFSDKDEKYVSYYVHIVRENDTIELISSKYGVQIDELKEYNNIEKITLGDKIIIPYINNETI